MTTTPANDPQTMQGDAAWFTHARFGMFIHWGLYAMLARHEWVRKFESLTNEDYDLYFRSFNPDLFDPQAWARAAADAGMKYMVITSKHHEGFCLWDSQYTEFKSTNTPARRCLLRPILDSFRTAGLRTGLYYSLIDWRHPHFTIDGNHPLRNHPDRENLNRQRDQRKYIEYLHDQVRELLKTFDPIDILWLDFTYPTIPAIPFEPEFNRIGKTAVDWDAERLVTMVRQLRPSILLNDRLGLDWGWDFQTPEQVVVTEPLTHNGQPVVWETLQTFSGSWGYHRDENTWKSTGMLIRMLIDTVSKGGNLILNVGPTGRGNFDQRALDRLAGIGRWMKLHNRAIYGCIAAPTDIPCPRDCRLTYNPVTRRLYVHVFTWPFKLLHLENLADRVTYAQLVNDGSEIKRIHHGQHKDESIHTFYRPFPKTTLTLELPVHEPDPDVPVIELFLK